MPGMSRRKVGIHSLYASNSSVKASIHCGLERHKNITACCIVFWTLLKPGIDVFSQLSTLYPTPFKAKVERHQSAYQSLSYRQLGLDTVVYWFWKGYAMDTTSGRATLIGGCDQSHIACS